MKPTIHFLEDIPVFTIDYPLLKTLANHYKIEPNALSPLYQIKNKVEDIPAEFNNNEKVRLLLNVLSFPVYKGYFQKAGAGYPLEIFEIYGALIEDKTYYVYVDNYRGQLKMLLFCKAKELSTYFVSRYAAMIDQTLDNVLPHQMPANLFFYILNVLDIVKKNYLNGVITGATMSLNEIPINTYQNMLENNLMSGDVRWLLPSAIKLMPGAHENPIDFDYNHILFPDNFNLTHEAKDAFGNPVINVSYDCKQLGIEYTHFWKYAIGFDFKTLAPNHGDKQRLVRGFFTPTDESNHLFVIDKKQMCHHDALSFNELLFRLENLFSDLLVQ